MYVLKSNTCWSCTDADEPMDITMSMDCPAGYICDIEKRRQANCSIIRQNYIHLGLGDILGGSVCPRGFNTLQNCPIGHYCPSPNTTLLCPEGFFCPHKSYDYTIPCQGCKAGSVIYKRNIWGSIACIAVIVFLGIIISCRILHRRRRNRTATAQEFDVRSGEKSTRPNLANLYPLLEDISKMLGATALYDGLWDEFDAEILFDCCNPSQAQYVSYESINQLMQLNPKQIDHFRRKMNECACLDLNSSTVTGEVFRTFFLEALLHAIYFSPSSDQVLAIFDEMWEQQSSNQDTDTIHLLRLYQSSISYFLSKEQISCVVKYLQCSTNPFDEYVPTSVTGHESSHLDISTSSEDTLISSQELKGSNYLGIIKSFTSNKGNGIKCPDDTIRKIDFLKNYPEAVASVLNEKPLGIQIEGFDVSFESLSLEVLVNGIRIIVVDNVTGRIRRSAMTSLMGCSGTMT